VHAVAGSDTFDDHDTNSCTMSPLIDHLLLQTLDVTCWFAAVHVMHRRAVLSLEEHVEAKPGQLLDQAAANEAAAAEGDSSLAAVDEQDAAAAAAAADDPRTAGGHEESDKASTSQGVYERVAVVDVLTCEL
jgi:hypothetical protein